MRITDLFEEDTLTLPNINVGDSIKVGKFKNRKAIVKGFTTDDHNQPVLKTTKGDQKLFKPRISKLEEGLIAVPRKMEQKICRILVKEILWWARDRFKGKTTTLSEQYKAFKALVKEYNVEIPKIPYPKDMISGFYIPVNFEGMPEKYLKNIPKDETIRFAIIWDSKSTVGGTGMLGGWMKNKKILAIKPLSVPYLQYYPSQRNHPDDLKIALVMMFETIQHELRHVVQTMLLSDYPEQSKTNNVNAGTKEYYTSPIEFDPQIGTAVHQFLSFWTAYPSKNIGLAMRKFVGMAPSNSTEVFSINEFFAAMRSEAPQRYKIAVKKFVLLVTDALSELPTP